MYDLRLDGFRQVERIIFRIKRCLIASFSISFASYFISLPLTVEYFGSVSLLTIPVNMIVVPIGTCAIIIGAITLFFGLVDMWWVCAALNRISYAFIYAFQILSRSMYNGEFCRRNVNLPLHISGPCVTMIMLLCAHVLFTKKLRSISLGRWSECGDEHGNGAGKCVAHGGSA
jgi:predicted membrane metal-binding protein